MNHTKRLRRALLPSVLAVSSLVPSQVQSSPLPLASDSAASASPDSGTSPEHWHVSDHQMRQLAAVANNLDYTSPEKLAHFDVIHLNAGRPEDKLLGHYYDMAHALNAIIKAPITDLVVNTQERLNNATSLSAGDRRFVIMSAKEYGDKPEALQETLQRDLLSHELSHIALHHPRNMLRNLHEGNAALKRLQEKVEWIDSGLDSKDKEQDQLDRIRSILMAIADHNKKYTAILKTSLPYHAAEDAAEYPGPSEDADRRSAQKSPPSDAQARRELAALIRQFHHLSMRWQNMEFAADKSGLSATCDAEGAKLSITELIVADNALSSMGMLFGALAVHKTEATSPEIAKTKALMAADANTVEENTIGLATHPLIANRLQRLDWLDKHEKCNNGIKANAR